MACAFSKLGWRDRRTSYASWHGHHQFPTGSCRLRRPEDKAKRRIVPWPLASALPILMRSMPAAVTFMRGPLHLVGFAMNSRSPQQSERFRNRCSYGEVLIKRWWATPTLHMNLAWVGEPSKDQDQVAKRSPSRQLTTYLAQDGKPFHPFPGIAPSAESSAAGDAPPKPPAEVRHPKSQPPRP